MFYCLSKISLSLLFSVLFLLSNTSVLQAQNLKGMLGKLEKKDFSRLEKELNKYKKKKPVKTSVYFVSSSIYADSLYDHYSIDSSYKYLRLTQESLLKENEKEVLYLKKYGINDSLLNIQSQALLVLAFQKTIFENTEDDFNHFITFYGENFYTSQATALRDKIAFHTAQKSGDFSGYKEFMDKYPTASQYSLAQEKYQYLVYKKYKDLNTTEGFTEFLEKHPSNDHKIKIERALFKKITYKNTIQQHLEFIQKYPTTSTAKVAWNWLYALHLDKKSFLNKYTENPLWKEHHSLFKNKDYFMIPYVEKQKVGFINDHGLTLIDNKYTIPFSIQTINPSQLFFAIQNDSTKKVGFIDRNGEQITNYIYDSEINFDDSYIIATKNNKKCIIEATGYETVPASYDKLVPLSLHILAAKKDGKWGIIGFTDSVLHPFIFDEIKKINNHLIVIKKGELSAISSPSQLLNQAILNFSYQDFEETSIPEKILGYTPQEKVELYDVKKDRIYFHNSTEILEINNGWAVQKDSLWQTFDNDGIPLTPSKHTDFAYNQNFYAIKNDSLWGLFTHQYIPITPPIYDAIKFIDSESVLLKKNKNKTLYSANTQQSYDISEYSSFRIGMIGLNSDSLILKKKVLITKNKKGKKGVFLLDNKKELLPFKYDKISILNQSYFIVKKQKKKSIIDGKNLSILLTNIDGISATKDTTFLALIDNKKFGLYITSKKIKINPIYEEIPRPYLNSDSLFRVKQNGKWFLIDHEENKITTVGFQALKTWTDTTILVKQNERWKIYNFKDNFYTQEIFKDFKYIKKTAKETIIRTYSSSGYGLISNIHGRIMPDDYSDIINLGTEKRPLYFVDKHIEQAGIHVILYINQVGKVIKKQAVFDDDFIHLKLD